ncbi:MAG TPA: PIN domain-containing protein [Bryobacteraceae bacterium]|nr:PIN domain-containing protein [Bryobacteraceae bacterium]
MRRILLDINVILDILLDCKPHVTASAFVWSTVETGQAKGWVPAHGVTTTHYLVRNTRCAAAARRTVDAILDVLEVARVDGVVIRRALTLGWADFEDAVTAAAAEAAHCDAIVTRDPKGFPDSPVRVITPEAAAPLFSRA